MKKIIVTLGVLAMAGTFSASSASGAIPPWIHKPIIIGYPQPNPEVPRPGPFTPKPDQNPPKLVDSNVVVLSLEML